MSRLSSATGADVAPPLPIHTARRRAGITVVICGTLLVAHVLVAHVAVSGKSATFDEPRSLLAAYLQRFEGDFRLNPEDPPLWKYLCSIPLGRQSLNLNCQGQAWDSAMSKLPEQVQWCTQTLYQTPGNDGDAVLSRARVMMLLLAGSLGAVIAAWSWQLGGPVAAVTATAVFALDPNFIGHAPLLKGDVAITLATVGVALSVWRLGRRVTVTGCVALAVCCAAGICSKFSAVLFIPIVAALFGLRAASPQAWTVLGRALQSRLSRLSFAAGLMVIVAVVSYASIWACYRFTYAAGGTADIRWPAEDELQRRSPLTELAGRHPSRPPDAEEIAQWKPSVAFRVYDFANHRRLLPQAFLDGLLFQHEVAQVWQNFLIGEVYMNGRWYYFPLAILFKEPLAVLLAMLLAAVVLARHVRTSRWWDIACVAVPATVFMVAAMTSSLNFGVRHAFPVIAMIYIAIGCAAASIMRRRPTVARVGIVVLLAAQLAETAWGFPNYIAFFNFPSGGSRGGIKLLADSNLDWGQDVKLLGDWQRRHPSQPLYVCLYGPTDPAYYGVSYRSFPGGTINRALVDSAASQQSLPPGVLAVGATVLQGVYLPDELQRAYGPLLTQKPLEVLGGTIYLYQLGSAVDR